MTPQPSDTKAKLSSCDAELLRIVLELMGSTERRLTEADLIEAVSWSYV